MIWKKNNPAMLAHTLLFWKAMFQRHPILVRGKPLKMIAVYYMSLIIHVLRDERGAQKHARNRSRWNVFVMLQDAFLAQELLYCFYNILM